MPQTAFIYSKPQETALMDEQEIINGCKQGDRKSQETLFDLLSERMLLLCLRYVKNLADAEELMLNGFFKFFKSVDRFIYTGAGSSSAYIKQVMVNECLMFLRKKGLQIVEELHAIEIRYDDKLFENISASEILKSVMALPDGYRTVFNMFVLEGLSHKEISAMLSISEGTSKSQLNKARMMLQKELRKKKIYHEK